MTNREHTILCISDSVTHKPYHAMNQNVNAEDETARWDLDQCAVCYECVKIYGFLKLAGVVGGHFEG